MKLIETNHIAQGIVAKDWQDAIQKAGDLLIQTGDIQQAYVDSMIESVKTLGPYIVLCPGFALAHAAPSEAVLQTSISLINLANPISFGSANDPVKVVMCLACKDKTSHIEKLQLISKKLMQEGMIDRLANAKTSEELDSSINQ